MRGKIAAGVVGTAVVLAAPACSADRAPRREGTAESAAAAATDELPAILFLGTSLTAGYGVGADRAFPALIQVRLDSAGLRYRVVNRGVSGQTSAGGLAQLDWVLRQPVAVLVLELGANDGLWGQDVDAMEANLQAVIDRTRAAHPRVRVVVAGMEAPPNLGPRYAAAFRAVFPRLARRNDAVLIPFLLEGVAADRELNQADGIHPTAAGHAVISETVWRALEPVLAAAASK